MDPVRPLGGPGERLGGPGRGRLLPAAVAAALLAVLLVIPTPSTVQVAEVDPPAPLVDTGTEAVGVVQDFLAALRRNQPARAAQLVSPDWSMLALPAMPFRLLPPGTHGADLEEALGWYAAVVGVGIAPCALDQATITGARVSCDLPMTSSFAGAARIGGRDVPVMFEVEGDAITAVLRDHLGSPALTSYCHWVERTIDQTVPLFDTECLPVLSAASAAVHPQAASDYLAAARLEAGRAYRAARSGVPAVALLVEHHNRSDQPGALTWRDASAAGFPGLVGADPAPALQDFLEWSKVMYRIELGTCTVDGRRVEQGLRVECPDATWGGPLVDGLALDAVAQPVSFVVDRAAIRAVEGGTAPGLAAAFDRFCEWVYANRPTAAFLFADGCTPVFTAEGAGAMLMTLSLYTDDAR